MLDADQISFYSVQKLCGKATGLRNHINTLAKKFLNIDAKRHKILEVFRLELNEEVNIAASIGFATCRRAEHTNRLHTVFTLQSVQMIA